MIYPTTTHARMTRHTFGGSASSGSPMQPAWASPCVLAHLGLPRPRALAAREPTIQEVEAMKKVEAIIRSERLQAVQDALDELGASGLTVTEVMGCGRQKGY